MLLRIVGDGGRPKDFLSYLEHGQLPDGYRQYFAHLHGSIVAIAKQSLTLNPQ